MDAAVKSADEGSKVALSAFMQRSKMQVLVKQAAEQSDLDTKDLFVLDEVDEAAAQDTQHLLADHGARSDKVLNDDPLLRA